MNLAMKVGGIILCGGRSSRMGRPKAWLPFGDELLLQRAVRIVGSVVDPVVVVAADIQDLPALPTRVEVVRDFVEARGPLGGLAAGLHALVGRVDAVFLSPCDAPFLQPAFIRTLIASLEGVQAAVPRVGGFLHPLTAAYRIDASDIVLSQLRSGRLRMVDLFELVPTRYLDERHFAESDPTLESLRNLNTPEEYDAALREISLR